MNENGGTKLKEYKLYFEGMLTVMAKDDDQAVDWLLGKVTTEDIYHWEVSQYLGNGKLRFVAEQ